MFILGTIATCEHNSLETHAAKALLSPRVGLFNFRPSRGGLNREGLIREGGLFTKSSDKGIVIFIPYFAESRYNFTA